MRFLKAIDTKVLRDVIHLKGQLSAIGLVIACGVGVYVGMSSTMRSLQSARTVYFAEQRFGDVFASLKRAPENVGRRLESIPGVQSVQTRVVAGVTLDVPGLKEAASARLVSFPEFGSPLVNNVVLRSGRFPDPGRWKEVVASEAFMEAHAFDLGQHLRVVINGTGVDLTVVGIGLSPEYMISVGPGLLFPDDKLFGVFWMRRNALGTAFDMDGAFNDVSLRLTRGAKPEDVIARVDETLGNYGGLGAIARKDQLSASFIETDLTQLQGFTFFIPALFLTVAAFLLNIVFGRLVGGQRGDIAALKAFGYRDYEVGLHYAKLLGFVVIGACALGLLMAAWMGSAMTKLYGEFYRFEKLPFQLSMRAQIEGVLITTISAGLGAWSAIRRTVSLPPAEAMRPEAPPSYRPTFLERAGLTRLLPTPLRIVLREFERKPLRGVLSVTGVAMATALTVVMAFGMDSVRFMLNVQFSIAQRENVQLTLVEPRSTGALSALKQLPGVLHAEPYRDVPVRLSNGIRSKRAAITGVPAQASLLGLLDIELKDIPVPEDGLVLSRKLAELLDVRAGEALQIQVLEGQRKEYMVPVARVVETYIGVSAYMRLAALCNMLGETPTLTSARLLVDDQQLHRLHEEVKHTPVIAGVNSRDTTLKNITEMLDENLGTSIAFSLGFALVIAFGVLYNTARITLSERARELATLRVLGFRRSEVSAILFGEMAVVVLLATPLGLAAGYGLASLLVRSPGYDTDQFRLPLVVSSTTYATAVLTVLLATIVSGCGAWRRLDRYDIVEVLKTRD